METLIGSMANHLQTLSGTSDYQLSDGEPDIRGWEVKNAEGDYIGDVNDFLFDTVHRKVRYLIVDLNNNEVGLDEHLVLVPIGLAEVHEEEDAVILPTIKTSQLLMLNAYQPSDFDENAEESVQSAYIGSDEGEDSPAIIHENRYDHEHFNEGNLYRRRKKISESQEETVLFPINEDLDDQVEIATDENMIAGADLDIPEDRK